MYSKTTDNYNLPQWQNNDKPTWLGDMNEAFDKIDKQMKQNHDDAIAGGVPQEVLDRISTLETTTGEINTKIGTDIISAIGTSITNAIVNLKSNIDTLTQNLATATTNIATITTQIGTDVITGIGTSITNAIVNLKTSIDNALNSIASITTRLGNTDISDVGATITGAIRNLADSGGGEVPPEVLNRISTLETTTGEINNKIGTDVISAIGISITNAIVNIYNSLTTAISNITTITTQIGTDVISAIGTSITNAIVNLNTKIGNINIAEYGTSITDAIVNIGSNVYINLQDNVEYAINKKYNNKQVYYKRIVDQLQWTTGNSTGSGGTYPKQYPLSNTNILSIKGNILIDTNYVLPFTWDAFQTCMLSYDNSNVSIYLRASTNTGQTINKTIIEVEYTKD